jgi:hypothetical protein
MTPKKLHLDEIEICKAISDYVQARHPNARRIGVVLHSEKRLFAPAIFDAIVDVEMADEEAEDP